MSGATERADTFLGRLCQLGYNVFAGVPCSLLQGVYAAIEKRDIPYYAATREDLAIGLSFGAALAGARPCVLMQNSGLGASINAALSLVEMHAVPMLLVISWRGETNGDAPEHIETGARMMNILRVCQIAARFACDDDAFEPEFHSRPRAVALIVRAGDFA